MKILEVFLDDKDKITIKKDRIFKHMDFVSKLDLRDALMDFCIELNTEVKQELKQKETNYEKENTRSVLRRKRK
jgi:hypothetical protein